MGRLYCVISIVALTASVAFRFKKQSLQHKRSSFQLGSQQPSQLPFRFEPQQPSDLAPETGPLARNGTVADTGQQPPELALKTRLPARNGTVAETGQQPLEMAPDIRPPTRNATVAETGQQPLEMVLETGPPARNGTVAEMWQHPPKLATKTKTPSRKRTVAETGQRRRNHHTKRVRDSRKATKVSTFVHPAVPEYMEETYLENVTEQPIQWTFRNAVQLREAVPQKRKLSSALPAMDAPQGMQMSTGKWISDPEVIDMYMKDWSFQVGKGSGHFEGPRKVWRFGDRESSVVCKDWAGWFLTRRIEDPGDAIIAVHKGRQLCVRTAGNVIVLCQDEIYHQFATSLQNQDAIVYWCNLS